MSYDFDARPMSTLSQNSSNLRAPQNTQVSTQTLLNALHTAYANSRPFFLDSSTSLVINTWLTAARETPVGRSGATVDVDLARRSFEHARRRAEDGCVVLGSLHDSTPSLLEAFVSSLPFTTPDIFYDALSAIRPFLTCVTPHNPSFSRHSGLAATLTLSLSSNLTGARLKLSSSGIDTSSGLLDIPNQSGYRAFDVFYYLLSSSASSSEREFLGLRHPSSYSLLKKSGTYDPPQYIATADDAASADEWKENLKAIGISGATRRDLVSILAALLKLGDTVGYFVDEEDLENQCEDAAGLLGLDPEVLTKKCSTEDRRVLISGIYESLVDWVISKANEAIKADFGRESRRKTSASTASGVGALTPSASEDEDTADVTVLDIPNIELGKAISLRTIFDDSEGINAEMKQDGVPVTPAGHSVVSEMQSAVAKNEPELGIMTGNSGRERELYCDRREGLLERVGHESEGDGFLNNILFPVPGDGIGLGRVGRFELPVITGSSRVWFHLCLHPTDESPATIAQSAAPWSAGSPSRQLRSWRLPEWANRRNKQLDYTADFDKDEFHSRYSRLGCKEGHDGIESFTLERGWSNGEVFVGNERVWIREGAWWQAESMLDMLPPDHTPGGNITGGGYQVHNPEVGSSFFGSPFGDNAATRDSSRIDLTQGDHQRTTTFGNRSAMETRSLAPTAANTGRAVSMGDFGLGTKGDDKATTYVNEIDPELANPNNITEQPITKIRRAWVLFTWCLTFWIPSILLRHVGRMKRPDVRMAWREKVVLCLLIALLNGFIVFFIIALGRILCPNYDKAWTNQEVGYHQGGNDFYVSVKGRVYDLSKFWQLDHSSGAGSAPPVQSSQMQPLAGKNLDPLFPIPLTVACPGLATDRSSLRPNTTLYQDIPLGAPYEHRSGPDVVYRETDLSDPNWFANTFLEKMKKYYKGSLVFDKEKVKSYGKDNQYPWVIIHNNVYDLGNYFYTKDQLKGFSDASYLATEVEDMIQSNPGDDVTEQWESFKGKDATTASTNYLCLNNEFYAGQLDFRDTPRCLVVNYILLSFTIILCAVILTKFLSALQLGSKRRPVAQDKFVICHVPAYTEGEDHLRKGLDSLTALAYDNKRKLICVICDGMIVGGGNDRPTPKIVLDILGVDPKVDPPALPFKSVGAGNEQLNYGKVYSGLYEYEGNVVPYIVVVKVGKEYEQTKSKPGNRGKRDSQILLMSFLNRVHHRAPMSPLELEMFHQINNIIGVDPELYEYMFMVDADTMVREDALNRLVASCSHDAKIAGICGETSLQNEERSWTTMIQVYEYYISHHLAKAFESLFGSVTCLPGCFCMYRLRTVDKGKPLIISDKVINDYSINNVDTLHKKNLLHLGEDRYLTTLMTKHFPTMSYKFVPDAYAQTAAPESWSVLVSQRRRWINSTIHNLSELMLLRDLCGFCCFSMRFVVFIDLFGTIILPATCAYIGYLIYRIVVDPHNIPIISIAIIAAVYGLQMIIFIIKRQWQHIGWMIIYILAFPIYSCVLPVFSFWKQDDFSWGTTRIVIGEKGSKQVVAMEDEGFDPRSIPLQTWEDYAASNNLPGRRGFGGGSEKQYNDDGYEMDDMRSVYSSVKPASTVLTGLKSQQAFHQPPQSPIPFGGGRPQMQQRQSNMSTFTSPYYDAPSPMYDPGTGTYVQTGSDHGGARSPYLSRASTGVFQSNDNLMNYSTGGRATPTGVPNSPSAAAPMNRAGRRSPMGFSGNHSRPASQSTNNLLPNFQNNITGFAEGPSDTQIVEAIQQCLESVDLDNVTKKQLKALTEQRLQTQLTADRKAFLDRQIDAELANM